MTISVTNLSKRYGKRYAVHDASFEVKAGKVTGFLGPNGAGKSTTLRMIVGLDQPTSGNALVAGKRYEQLRTPLREVGALLDAKAAHSARRARDHLRWIAATHGISRHRVEEVMEITGISAVAGRRVGSFSLGMAQRLGIAVALLGDPGILILDEPVNGLDPDGVTWIRNLLRGFADEGRTVFLSSHLLGELSMIADHIVVIAKGGIISDAPLHELVAPSCVVRVRTPSATKLRSALSGSGVRISSPAGDRLEIEGLGLKEVAERAAAVGAVLYEIGEVSRSLEDVYNELTRGRVEYSSQLHRRGTS